MFGLHNYPRLFLFHLNKKSDFTAETKHLSLLQSQWPMEILPGMELNVFTDKGCEQETGI